MHKIKLHKTSKCLWPVYIDMTVVKWMFFFQRFHESLSNNPSLCPPGYQPHPETLISPFLTRPPPVPPLPPSPKKLNQSEICKKLYKSPTLILQLFFQQHPSKFWRAWLPPWNVPYVMYQQLIFLKQQNILLSAMKKDTFECWS